MIAFVVPGQGSEEAGMGLDVAAAFPAADEVFDRASSSLGEDVRAWSRGGRPLLRTDVAQAVLTTTALAHAAALESLGVRPDLVFGYSAGETAAAALAGCVDVGTAVALALARGRLQDGAVRVCGGGMAALEVDGPAALAEALAHGRQLGTLDLANDVDRGWALFTGSEPALRAVCRRYGAVPMGVNGPWHSPMLAHLVPTYAEMLRSAAMRPPVRAWVVADRAAVAHTVDEAVSALSRQLAAPMRLRASLETMLASGVRRVVLLGPRRKLATLLRTQLAGRASLEFTDTARDLDAVRGGSRA